MFTLGLHIFDVVGIQAFELLNVISSARHSASFSYVTSFRIEKERNCRLNWYIGVPPTVYGLTLSAPALFSAKYKIFFF